MEQDAARDEAMTRWLQDTHVVDDDGVASVVCHGGVATKAFRPFTHFGTRRAAGDRLRHRGVDDGIVEARLSIRNPVAFRDTGYQHNLFMFLNDLSGCYEFYERAYETMGIEDYELTAAIVRLRATARSFGPVVRYLESIGFDGLKYENLVEDRGSTSWAIFRPGQVWRVGAPKPDGGTRLVMPTAEQVMEPIAMPGLR